MSTISEKDKVFSSKTLSEKIRERFKGEKFSAWNPYSKQPDGSDGISDEYYINEIIGIEELPYDEFIKEKEDNNDKPKKPVQLELPFEEFKREKN